MFSFIKQLLKNQNDQPLFTFTPTSKGLSFDIREDARADLDLAAKDNMLFQLQLLNLRMLQEQGKAQQLPDRFEMATADVLEQDLDFYQMFHLPDFFNGNFKFNVSGVTNQANFKAKLKLMETHELTGAHLTGPFLQIGENSFYSLTEPQWAVINAIESFHRAPQNKQSPEYLNNMLIHQLKSAVQRDKDAQTHKSAEDHRPALKIDLGQFKLLSTVIPEKIELSVSSDSAGNYIITPVFARHTPADIHNRLNNLSLSDDAPEGVMHIKDDIVLLQPQVKQAIKEVKANRVIPKDKIADFCKTPSAFFQNECIDFDQGFSMRVTGAEIFVHRYFGDIESQNNNWFSAVSEPTESKEKIEPLVNVISQVQSFEELEDLEQKIKGGLETGADAIIFNDQLYNLNGVVSPDNVLKSLHEKLESNEFDADENEIEEFSLDDNEMPKTQDPVVLKIESNDEHLDFSVSNATDNNSEDASKQFDTSFSTENLLRQPYPHQEEGIRWILQRFCEGQNSPEQTGGGLLADDMGLGKSFMTLVAIEELLKRNEKNQIPQKPILIVAPLSLLENWKDEVFNTFAKFPFRDIVILQSDYDLHKYLLQGAANETKLQTQKATDALEVRFALKIGQQYEPWNLEHPGNLVLTTYDTLRNYQFSLSRIDWFFVAFDEAQNIKNPNTLATIAAKALKADFKLLISGTPVENSLRDIWNLMDTALPGLLGAWQDFRTTYISPINAAFNITKKAFEEGSSEDKEQAAEQHLNFKIAVGQKLRSAIGNCMLRRTKEDNLPNLPKKVIFAPEQSQNQAAVVMPELGKVMSNKQLACYDNIIEEVQNANKEVRKHLTLPALSKMKLTSIHHDLADPKKSLEELIPAESCKIQILDTILSEIKAREEKVIIFAISKKLQEMLALYLQHKYQVPVRIVNGDTKTSASFSSHGALSRKQILDDFQARPGFGIIVLSPIAVGVGLTIVEANNVIHIERHWNPAKEAQATDRVYRIGQKRQVNVYLPMALHPKTTSFDLKLDLLLQKKINLSSAVVTTEIVQPQEMQSLFD